jgi:hypothetical protein
MDMAVISDFEIIGSASVAEGGKWRSRNFSAGGRKILPNVEGKEPDNAYVTLALTSPEGGQDVTVRIIVNNHPLPVMVFVPKASQRAWLAAFPASFLKDGGNNFVTMHSVGERVFFVLYVICHFRQDS